MGYFRVEYATLTTFFKMAGRRKLKYTIQHPKMPFPVSAVACASSDKQSRPKKTLETLVAKLSPVSPLSVATFLSPLS